MFAILNSLNVHNFPISQPILMILVSKFMVHRALSDKTYLSFRVAVPFNFYRRNKKISVRMLVQLNSSNKLYGSHSLSKKGPHYSQQVLK